MTNKEASNKQEHMVADFLGWEVVSGSGARPFRPGDVQNENYLVECKTHTKEQPNTIFYKKYWSKIVTEARSVNKYPALITDNGTQKSENTWVMIPNRVIIPEIANKLLIFFNTSTSGNTITFRQETAYSAFKAFYIDSKINYFEQLLGEDIVAIMPLEEFRKFYQLEFEL